jgi:hypothetical protein
LKAQSADSRCASAHFLKCASWARGCRGGRGSGSKLVVIIAGRNAGSTGGGRGRGRERLGEDGQPEADFAAGNFAEGTTCEIFCATMETAIQSDLAFEQDTEQLEVVMSPNQREPPACSAPAPRKPTQYPQDCFILLGYLSLLWGLDILPVIFNKCAALEGVV